MNQLDYLPFAVEDQPVFAPSEPSLVEAYLWPILTALLSLFVIGLVGYMTNDDIPESTPMKVTLTLAGLSGLGGLVSAVVEIANIT